MIHKIAWLSSQLDFKLQNLSVLTLAPCTAEYTKVRVVQKIFKAEGGPF